MIHAYDKLYLSVAQKNLACMLDYMVNDLKRPLETVWQWFCMSNTASRFERGDCSVVAGMSGVEIAYEVLQEAGEPSRNKPPLILTIAALNIGQAGRWPIISGVPVCLLRK